jgi:hypothetical protein
MNFDVQVNGVSISFLLDKRVGLERDFSIEGRIGGDFLDKQKGS